MGKSSLLNALARQECAIVTDVPGTTRDIVRADVMLGGVRVHFADTAGIRAQGDRIEQIGVARARQAVAGADTVLLVLDASAPLSEEDQTLLHDTDDAPRVIVLNKSDLAPALRPKDFRNAVSVSAATGDGLPALEEKISRFAQGAGESALTQARHMALAREAAAALRRAAQDCAEGQSVDVAELALQEALRALGRITGEQVDEMMIDDIFATFCVGK